MLSSSVRNCRYVITATGERIGYDTCFARDCLRPLDRCTCPGGPTPPNLGAGALACIAVSQIELPATVRTKALQAGAEDWVGGLPELVAGLERDWGITVGRAFDAATEAYVAEAVSADGTPAVLKLLVPRSELVADEITVLR